MTAKEIYIKYFLTDLKRKVFDEVYEEMKSIKSSENKSDINVELLVSQIIQKLSDVNTKPVLPSFTCTSKSNSIEVVTPFITSDFFKSITIDVFNEIKNDMWDYEAALEVNKIVNDQVDSYNIKKLSDMQNTIETLMCLIEVEEMCIKMNHKSIKDIINTRYSELDETDQLTITLTTGYKQ